MDSRKFQRPGQNNLLWQELRTRWSQELSGEPPLFLLEFLEGRDRPLQRSGPEAEEIIIDLPPDLTEPSLTTKIPGAKKSRKKKIPVGCPHTDSRGNCLDCTKEKTIECGRCEQSILLAKAIRCQNFKECGNAFCHDCDDDKIKGERYCFDCATIECDGCRVDFDRDKAKTCKKRGCQSELVFCDECADTLLTSRGHCFHCAKQTCCSCGDCGGDFITSRLSLCSNCLELFCPNCKPKRRQNCNGCLEERS
ncbi:hypothetical protein HY628_01745 [Candidatus Uhrbacteria bacterium]|nr:hypothetical protein [Candidatus Uhrbacteria bacterium]